MALVEEYYELNEAEGVTVAWKFIQIGTYVVAGCLGLWCAYTMDILRTKFGDKCYLFTPHKDNETDMFPIHIDWESDLYCDYTQYIMVTSFIMSTIWATFFLMCGKGGKSPTGLPQPWRIVFCSLIFNIIYFSLVLSASIQIQRGTEFFCKHPDDLKSITKECPTLRVIQEQQKTIHMTVTQLNIVVKTSWGCTFSWLILILLPFFRIVFVVDFRLYKICVFQIDETIQNKKEQVLKITNYEEPRKLYFKDRRESSENFNPDIAEDVERGVKRGRGKTNEIPRGRLRPNTAFYVTTDIRMLDREKRRKKIMLDEAFERNQALRSQKFIISDNAAVEGPAASQSLRLLYRYPKLALREKSDSDSEEERSNSAEVLDKFAYKKKQL